MIKESVFGRGPGGEQIRLYTLSNSNGLEASITNYGGIVTRLMVPDRHGSLTDVVLGFDSFDPYLERHPYFGAIIGRISGRLTPPRFWLNGRLFDVAANQPPHHLHGGYNGFDRRVWTPSVERNAGGSSLKLRYHSPDGEEGYPGNLDVEVSYALDDNNSLVISYLANSDRTTPVSLTNHSYFNLMGEHGGSTGTHQVQIFADEFTPVAPDFSPTGQRRSLDGLANDFRKPAAINDRIGDLFGQHGDNYLVRRARAGLQLAARVFEPGSGRVMDVLTTESFLQFYTGVNLDGTSVGKGGRVYNQFSGLCFECQGYPSAPHFPAFESIFVSPGGRYRQETRYRFGTNESEQFPVTSLKAD